MPKMPGNTYYWNSADFDDDESVANTIKRSSYVDPWDLENYAYIRDHLDSLELNSETSSFGEPVEASSFYYAPLKNERYPSPDKKNFDSLLESEYGTAKYAEIDEVFEEESRAKPNYEEELYGVRSLGLHHVEEDTKNKRSSSATAYDHLHQPLRIPVKRRMSYSFGDQGNNSVYSPRIEYLTTDNKQKHHATPPIFEELESSFQPNFGLSNYGHLKIDYSCSWDNLNKYISN
ncbi:hypothetical protein RN001_011627 [Aquatica leii]|uniref:Uncharacterized protein n=1 Tax=Aquatica leii TaxID=1421715 RepID=A0AAN7SP56_9COLE|nr:hypothetical protein RN001_011627 [Aquatica leii]